MKKKNVFEIFIGEYEGNNVFMCLNPYTNMCIVDDNPHNFFEAVTAVKEADNDKSDFEFSDGIDQLFLKMAEANLFAGALLMGFNSEKD